MRSPGRRTVPPSSTSSPASGESETSFAEGKAGPWGGSTRWRPSYPGAADAVAPRPVKPVSRVGHPLQGVPMIALLLTTAAFALDTASLRSETTSNLFRDPYDYL